MGPEEEENPYLQMSGGESSDHKLPMGNPMGSKSINYSSKNRPS